MKSLNNKMKFKKFSQNILATTITALCTGLIISSTVQASDIDIYQEAKSGDITLMMLFDISGSMGAPQLINDREACDIPSYSSGTNSSLSNSGGSETSTNGSPIYTRYYCNASNVRKYSYKREGTSTSNYKYFDCGSDGSFYQNDCINTLSIAPSISGFTPEGTNPTYYYKTVSDKFYDRITRLKDAMFDLLNGNTVKGIEKVSDDKVIGLSAYSFNGIGRNGFILVPARRLSDSVTIGGVTKTQRQVLMDAVATKLYARGGTPTGNAYAEAAAYLMGTKTFNDSELSNFSSTPSTGAPVFFTYNNSGTTYYIQCNTWSSAGACTSWPNDNNTQPRNFNFLPLDLSQYSTATCTQNAGGSNRSGTCYYYKGRIVRSDDYSHGFNYSTATKTLDGSSYLKPASLEQTDEVKKCSGQGIYVLTDGAPSNQHNQAKAMKNALNGATFSCTEQGGDNTNPATNCALAFNQKLLNSNPLGLKIKTAVVGFGGDFNKIDSYDPKKTQAENLDLLGTINTPTKAAAEWGIKGEGGWYSGSSSEDVVNSVNKFINSLGADIPAVTTGSPTVPRDSLNPSVLQKEAYYPQFQPTPDKTYQLWAGNLKKYNVIEGILRDKSNNKIVDDKGRIIDNYDLWAPAVDSSVKDADETTYGSTKFALMGGVKSQLKLRTEANTENRKLLTNRIANGTGTTAAFGSSTTLRQVRVADLTDTTYQNDLNRGYLISLLGYGVDAANPTGINLTTAPELRQVGAVMHSSPLLVTSKGKITYTNNILGSTNREDYVLFGTTQGLLHVVDAKTGKEKFAFVPNEMVENQKEAFLKHDSTSGGLSKLYYGIDAPWATYTEYAIDSSNNLTVGTGRNSQKGKQIAYGGLRMGGRSYYALDLADMNNPKLQFQISPSDKKVYYKGSSKLVPELQYMGQSWSKPAIAWVKWGKSRKRVMFVGGGYDAGGDDGDARTNGVKGPYAGYESDTYNQTNAKGGGVYMFDADTGDLLWWASKNATTSTPSTDSGVIGLNDGNLKYSVVSEIRTEDRNADGLVDHLYFGDLGGQLFRIDLNNNAATLGAFAKTPRLLLNLNAAEKSPRFYEMPGFSIYDYAGKTFAVISIGTGNRSQPLKDYTVGISGYDYDAVYNIYDKDVARKDLYTATTFTKTLIKADLGEITQANRNDDTTLVAPYTGSGWFYRFKSSGSDAKLQSAKVFATPIVLNSRMFVSTFDGSKPGLSGDCGAGVKGESFLQQFCMPYGQCVKATGNNGGNGDPQDPECTSPDGCSTGSGIQTTTVVDDKKKCNPAVESCQEIPPPQINNSNYCISTGNRGATTISGIISAGSSKICLVPQRWYEFSGLR